jgi:tRNA G18 (ribose-2'-O)-methylase SpoU
LCKQITKTLVRKKTTEELGRIAPQQYGQGGMPVVVVVDNVRSLHNVGSFFRTCDAFGAAEHLLSGITAVPPHPEIHKTALGAEDSVSWRFFRRTDEAVDELKAGGYTVLAIEQAEGSVSLEEFRPEADTKYALILGNEVDGVADEVLACCDGAIEIPQAGSKHSLNVSVAAGVVLWEVFRRLTFGK